MTPKCCGTVLLVEDDPMLAVLQMRLLTRKGFIVIVAHSGPDAIQKARDEAVLDLILMDINLGAAMDGVEAARCILAIRDIPVIFLSSHTEETALEHILEVPSHGYVLKSDGDSVLVTSIHIALNLFRTHRAACPVAPAMHKIGTGTMNDAESLVVADRLEQVIREKDLLLKELQHRVKNTLSMITALVDVEKSQSTGKELRAALNRIYLRIQTFTCLHSLMWKTSGNLKLDEYIKSIAGLVKECYSPESKDIEIDLDIDPLAADVRTLSNLGIIVNEALTNSMQHGFVNHSRGRISVQGRQERKGYHLIIKDNGCGCEDNLPNDNGVGFGLVLVRELVAQMGGTCFVECSSGFRLDIGITL